MFKSLEDEKIFAMAWKTIYIASLGYGEKDGLFLIAILKLARYSGTLNTEQHCKKNLLKKNIQKCLKFLSGV